MFLSLISVNPACFLLLIFSHQNEIRKWLSNAFEKEVKKWSDDIEPELMDGYYFSSLAFDVLPVGYGLYCLSNHHFTLAINFGILKLSQKKRLYAV